MNRGQAERAVSESNLDRTSKLVLLTLLRRAHNDTLQVPDWRTPSQPGLAAECGITVRWLRIVLAHLALHQWVKTGAGTGRGRRTTYALLPAGPGLPCYCDRKRRAPMTEAERARRYRAGKAEALRDGQPERRNSRVTKRRNSVTVKPQVSPETAPRDSTEGEDLTSATDIPSCWRKLCASCRQRPSGPGSIICPACRTTIEARVLQRVV